MREFTTPVGTDLVAIALSGEHIAGIQIDNPSGSWLRVTGIEQYVPPYVTGWGYPVSPIAASLSVLFTTSPSGTPSELVGGPVVVRLYGEPVPASAGQASGAEQSQSPVGATAKIASVVATAIEAGQSTIVVPKVMGKRIVPLAFYAAQTVSGFPPIFSDTIRATISIQVLLSGPTYLLPALALSPEVGLVQAPFPQGTRLPLNTELEVWAASANGGGKQNFQASVLYYEQEA